MAGGVAVEEGTFVLAELIRQNSDALITVGVFAHMSGIICEKNGMTWESASSALAFGWVAKVLTDICGITEEDMDMRLDARMEELGIVPPTNPDV